MSLEYRWFGIRWSEKSHKAGEYRFQRHCLRTAGHLNKNLSMKGETYEQSAID